MSKTISKETSNKNSDYPLYDRLYKKAISSSEYIDPKYFCSLINNISNLESQKEQELHYIEIEGLIQYYTKNNEQDEIINIKSTKIANHGIKYQIHSFPSLLQRIIMLYLTDNKN